MKKATFALTTLAALTVAAAASAQDPAGGPTPTPAPLPAPGPHSDPNAPEAVPPAPEVPPLESQTVTSQTTLTAAELTPPAAPAPPPRETITVRQSYRPNRPLLYTGGALLIGSYAATAALTSVRDVRDGNHDQPTYIPVAGPWLHLMNTPNAAPADKIVIGASGIAQAAGVLVGVLSFIVPERVPAATIEARGVRIDVTAFGTGLAALGSF